MLRQVLANLLASAVKYSDESEAVLTVSSKGHDEILFEIRDSGIGIPEEKIDILFQPFLRVDESFSSRSEGAGLGLAISKRFVEMMGGKIWVAVRSRKRLDLLLHDLWRRPIPARQRPS